MMRIKAFILATVMLLSGFNAFSVFAIDNAENTVISYATDSAVISQNSPKQVWNMGEELTLDVNNREVALVKFALPEGIDENSEVKLVLHGTKDYQSELRLYGLDSKGWSGESITWENAGSMVSETDYKIFSGDTESLGFVPLLGSSVFIGEIDVTRYVLSRVDAGAVSFGIAPMTSKAGIASHINSNEEMRPQLVVVKNEVLPDGEFIDNHKYAEALKFTADLGYLPSKGGMYYPDDVVTVEAVNKAFELMLCDTKDIFVNKTDITMKKLVRQLVSAAGYDVYMKVPSGKTYESIAKQIGIYDGIQTKDLNGKITRGVFAQLLYNALNTDMLIQDLYGDSESYVVAEERTILSETRHIYRVKGIIDGNSRTTLTTSVGIDDSMVSIDKVRYYNEIAGVEDMIGYKVTAWYYQRRGEIGELLHVKSEVEDKYILDISYNEISSYSNNTYKYAVEGTSRIKEAKTDKNFDLIYNGVCWSTHNGGNDLKPAYGSVRLINNDGVGGYDVVIVTEYENYVVFMMDDYKKVLVDYYDNDNTVTLDEELLDELVLIDSDGNNKDFSAIRAWDVVSVAASSSGNVVKAIVSGTTVSGVVEAIYSSKNEILIDNKKYTIAPSFSGYFSKAFKVGDDVTLVLDAVGNIAACKGINETDAKYGYLIDSALSDETFSDFLQVKIFSENGKMLYADCAKNVKIDGNVKKGGLAQYNALGGASLVPQIVVYTTNSNGEIKAIDTGKVTDAKEGDTRLTEILTSSGTLRYRPRARSLSGKLILDNNTKIFAVPDEPKTKKDSDFEVKTIAYFASDSTWANVSAYAMNEDTLIPTVMTVRNDSGHIYQSCMVVKSVENTLDSDGNVVCKIIGMVGSTEDTIVVSNDYGWYSAAISYNEGDLIRFKENIYGDIIDLNRVYGVSEGFLAANNPTKSDISASGRISQQYVYNKKGNVVQVVKDLSNVTPDAIEVYDTSVFTVYVYDKQLNENKVYRGSAKDIADYVNLNDSEQKVVICTDYGDPVLMIVYK